MNLWYKVESTQQEYKKLYSLSLIGILYAVRNPTMTTTLPDLNNIAYFFQQFTATFPNHDGSVRYATAGVIPSNSIGNRVLALVFEGLLEPNESATYQIVWDFSNVASDRTIALEGPLQGQFNLRCHTWNANRVLSYDASRISEKILMLTIRLPILLKSAQNVFATVQINDLGTPVSKAIPTTCNVLNSVTQQIQTQLMTMFPPNGPVGAVFITVNNTPVEVFSAASFTASTLSFDLPPYFIYPQEISMIDPQNTWGQFTFLAGPDSFTLFYIALDQLETFVLSKTGYPVCSNVWAEISNFGITDIQVFDLFTFGFQFDNSQSTCSPLNNSKTAVVYIPSRSCFKRRRR